MMRAHVYYQRRISGDGNYQYVSSALLFDFDISLNSIHKFLILQAIYQMKIRSFIGILIIKKNLIRVNRLRLTLMSLTNSPKI